MVRSDQVAQGFFWLDFQNFQGSWQYNLSGRPVPVLPCPNVNLFFFLITHLKHISIYVHWLLSFCCVPLGKAWLCPLDDHLVGIGRLLLALPKAISSADQTSRVLSGSFYKVSTPVPSSFSGHSCRTCCSSLMSFLSWGSKIEYSIMWSNKCWTKGHNYLSYLQVMLLLMQPSAHLCFQGTVLADVQFTVCQDPPGVFQQSCSPV